MHRMAKHNQSHTPHTYSELEHLPRLQQIILGNRGITTKREADIFCMPKYDRDTHDPFLLPDMEQAVNRIITALERSERIAIYADFDADGIPGAVILHDFFKKLKHEDLMVYIPHRHDEGYGVHKNAIDYIKGEHASLMITVDVGITYADEITYAEELGIDVIVTDHHEPQEIVPEACAVVNPKLNDYPDQMICGAAVAWKLAQAVLMKLREIKPENVAHIPLGWEKWLLDMVGIATISDMVPLVKENRVLAHYGLHVLRKNTRTGLRSLMYKNFINHRTLSEDDIGFTITPRLNAASRMAHPRDAFELLIATDSASADTAADHLTGLNNERKKLVARIVKAAHAKLKHRDTGSVIVVGDPDWNTGVSGLVAGKLAEHYGVPAFVWSREGNAIKGSCRSNGVDSVVDLMKAADEDAFLQFGGHSGAGGFSVDPDQIHYLSDRLHQAYERIANDDQEAEAPYTVDTELSLDEVTLETYALIKALGPYGIGNPRPLFEFSHIKIHDIRLFGKGDDHLEITFVSPLGKQIKAIAFYTALDAFNVPIERDGICTLIAEFDYSTFRGKSELRLKIVDIV